MKKALITLTAALLLLTGCANTKENTTANEETASVKETETVNQNTYEDVTVSDVASVVSSEEYGFTTRDTDASYNLAESTVVTMNGDSVTVEGSGAAYENGVLTITQEGTYYLTGTLNGHVEVNVMDSEKVQIVLSNATINSSDYACIYIVEADKVFLSLDKGTTNTLSDGTAYNVGTEDSGVDGCIFSKADLTINGSGTLVVNGNYAHGIVSKDDLIVTNGTITVDSTSSALSGKDCVKIGGGTLTLNAGSDGIKSTNDTDEGRGYVYISGGTITIDAQDDGINAATDVIVDGGELNITTADGATYTSASSNWFYGDDSSEASAKGIKAGNSITINNGEITVNSTDDSVHSNNTVTINGGTLDLSSGDDAIHADALLTINGGTITISAHEGLEATQIVINDGTVDITASDDGINAAQKVSGVTPTIEINGGDITVNMGQGDTDALDSNGNIFINGGTITISAQSPFDYDGQGAINGGTVTVNGSAVTQMSNQMMGGMGGMGQTMPGGNASGMMPGGNMGGFGGGGHGRP